MIKHHFQAAALAALCFFTNSCSDDNSEGAYEPQTYNVSGKVEKGPFVSGSTITMQPMDAKMQASGESYSTTITDNAGNFTFGSKLFNAPFAELTANGYFFNEGKRKHPYPFEIPTHAQPHRAGQQFQAGRQTSAARTLCRFRPDSIRKHRRLAAFNHIRN